MEPLSAGLTGPASARHMERAPFGDCKHMLVRTRLIAAAALSLMAFAWVPASAQSLRYANQGDLQSLVPADAKAVKIDDYTVDFILSAPNPILISQWDAWYIMDKKWAEENNCAAPTPVSATTPSYCSLHANGTGPFTIESHQPGV